MLVVKMERKVGSTGSLIRASRDLDGKLPVLARPGPLARSTLFFPVQLPKAGKPDWLAAW